MDTLEYVVCIHDDKDRTKFNIMDKKKVIVQKLIHLSIIKHYRPFFLYIGWIIKKRCT